MRISDWSSDVCSSDLAGEIEVAELLTLRGWVVKNLNETKKNNPTYDLQATQGQVCLDISVKVARSKNRHLRLGRVASLERLTDEAFRSEERRVGKEGVSTCSSRW